MNDIGSRYPGKRETVGEGIMKGGGLQLEVQGIPRHKDSITHEI